MTAPLVLNKAKEQSTFIGVGSITLTGAVKGCLPFSALLLDQDTVMYYADDFAGNWESGVGTYDAPTNTILRTTVISSSNLDQIVNFPQGAKTITSAMDAKVLQVLLDLIPSSPWW